MDSAVTTMMMQMARMGLSPEDVQRMMRDNSQNSLQPPPFPIFRPDLSPAELSQGISQYNARLAFECGLGPVPSSRQPRELLLQHQTIIRRRTERSSSRETDICTTIVGFERHCSNTPLEALERSMSRSISD